MASPSTDFKQHFASFCTGENEACSYEDWIDALTTSQAQDASAASSDAASGAAAAAPTDVLLDFDGMSKVIDPKYYQEACEERQFWNGQVAAAGCGRVEVAARQSGDSMTSESMADFMMVDNGAAGAGSKEVAGDLMSFD